ncbi:unnamed protein product [Rotaria magnacalcarata]|uniref:Ion transport domain-containing protein n=1 Tax=Rotaria magnacalcarata TaxID=392030 RepID=A0A815G2Z3_9BILA|nr:unnamed protein product [Rotaria magnacalcarata]
MILNLFLALLLNSFGSNVLTEKEDEDDKIGEAIDRIQRFFHFLIENLVYFFCGKKQRQKDADVENKNNENSLSTTEELVNSIPSANVNQSEDINFAVPLIHDLSTTHEGTEEQPIHGETIEFHPKQSTLYTPPACCHKMILKHFSCCAKCIPQEDVHTRQQPTFSEVLEIFDKIFTIIFTLELILKWFAYGIKNYFTDGWNRLDFVIVVVSVLGTGLHLFGVADIPAFKSMRTLRALRPLKALSKFAGIRIVVNALFGAIPSISNVLLVCLVFWLIFSIMGVQLFGGKFYKCVYVGTHDRVAASENVTHKTDCLNKNFTWENSRLNFDNVLNGYLALLQIVSY